MILMLAYAAQWLSVCSGDAAVPHSISPSDSALAVFTGSGGNENRQEAKGSDKPTLEGAKGS
jgi:hypothetical protein